MHLCSECAEKMRKENNLFPDTNGTFEEMMQAFFAQRKYLQPFGGFSFAIPTLIIPRVEVVIEDNSAEQAAITEPAVETDPEMKKRREVNILKEQMKQAVASEAFEEAAQIRDSIRALEKTDEETSA